jgi:hypothetical protein
MRMYFVQLRIAERDYPPKIKNAARVAHNML